MLYNCSDLTFNILSVHVLKWGNAHHIVEPRPFSALVFHISGSSRIITKNVDIVSQPGDVIFVPEGLGYESFQGAGEVIAINFRHSNYTSDIEIYKFPPAKLNCLFLDILNAWNKKKNIFEINIHMFNILLTLKNSSETMVDKNAPFYQAIQYINSNFKNSELSVTDICKNFKLSETSFRTKMSKEYNMSPIKYINNLRIDYACRLLAENLLTVEEIATLSGFSDSKYFSRVIKGRYGIPPSKLYR